jgi:flagellar protein FlaJ
MPLNNYQKMCYRKFGRIAESGATDKLKEDLESAHIEMRAGAYLSCVWFNTILAAVVSVIFYITLIIFLHLNLGSSLLLSLIPVVFTVFVYFYYIRRPAIRAKARGKKIDMHLPYALNFISALSSAGITPAEIFKGLSKQEVYGEIKEEALWIYRDVSLLGGDIISAIKTGVHRTPSEKFKEFLQGAIVTVQSGGSLKSYFMIKTDQYMRENRLVQKQLIESLGIMAECYVATAVAGVLLIIIIIPLLMIMSKSGSEQLFFMYIFSFLVIPLIHAGFAVVLSSMSAKV